MSKHFRAEIRFLLTEEGGRSTSAMSGIRPHIRLGEVFTSCVIRSTTSDEVFELGRDYNVDIEIIFWEHYSHLFSENEPGEFFEGNHMIAKGRFLT